MRTVWNRFEPSRKKGRAVLFGPAGVGPPVSPGVYVLPKLCYAKESVRKTRSLAFNRINRQKAFMSGAGILGEPFLRR